MPELMIRLTLWMSLPMNLGVAYVLAQPDTWPGQWLGLPASVDPIYAGFAALMVGLFGLVYGWLALQPQIHRPLLAVGALGKAGAFLLIAGLWLADAASVRLAGAACIDLVLAACWILWLRLQRR